MNLYQVFCNPSSLIDESTEPMISSPYIHQNYQWPPRIVMCCMCLQFRIPVLLIMLYQNGLYCCSGFALFLSPNRSSLFLNGIVYSLCLLISKLMHMPKHFDCIMYCLWGWDGRRVWSILFGCGQVIVVAHFDVHKLGKVPKLPPAVGGDQDISLSS